MADKQKIAEEVAAMTKEEQDKVLKVGKIAGIVTIVGAIPFLLGIFSMAFLIFASPKSQFVDKAFIIGMVCVGAGLCYIIGVLVFVKVKYPFYSDAKYKYIKKSRQ